MNRDPFEHARRQVAAQQIRDEEEGRIGKVLRLCGDWLTTENNDELLEKVDRTLGTNLRERNTTRGPESLPHVDEENRVSRRAEPSKDAPEDSPKEARAERAGPIVIVKARRAVCGTCRGHGALEFNEETRRTRPIACPDCGTKPKANR